MNASELARKLLEWGEAAERLAALEEEIAAAVLAMGKTQTAGNVRATYSKGRTTLDYAAVGADAPSDIVAVHTTLPEPRTDWKSVVEAMGIERSAIPVASQGEPSVRLKLVTS